MKLRLNFSTKKYKSPVLDKVLLIAALILILLPFGINAYLIIDSSNAIRTEEQKQYTELVRNQELENNLVQINNFISSLNIPEVRRKIDFYYNSIVLMNLKWLRLLTSIELIIPDDVRIRRITPQIRHDVSENHINLSFEGLSKDFAPILDFLKKLEDSPLFDKVYLTSIRNRMREAEGYEYFFQVLYLQPVE